MFGVLGNKPLSMKKSALLILVALSFFACKKETEPPRTRIVVGNLKFTINPSIQPPFTYYLPINGVFIGALAQLEAEHIDTAEIKNIRPSRATLTALFGNGNLDFIQAASIRLCQLGDNEENCGQEVFYRDPTPFDIGAELELGGSAVKDVRDYVLQKQINVQVKLESLRDVPQGTFEVVVEMEFEVR
jgi:hypothetical protein